MEKVLVWINKFKVKTNQYHAAALATTFAGPFFFLFSCVCVCERESFRVFDILNAPFHWRIYIPVLEVAEDCWDWLREIKNI